MGISSSRSPLRSANANAAPHPLDGNYTIFGHVLSGMDVLAQITPRDSTQGYLLSSGDIIITITIEER